jgi:hypothetical protein
MPVTAEYINKNLISSFDLIMDKNGVTPEYLAKKLKRELNASKPEAFKATTREFDGEGNLIKQTEEVIYSKPMVDWKIRQEARKDAHKLRGDYPPEQYRVAVEGESQFRKTVMEAIGEQAPEVRDAIIGRIRDKEQAE